MKVANIFLVAVSVLAPGIQTLTIEKRDAGYALCYATAELAEADRYSGPKS